MEEPVHRSRSNGRPFKFKMNYNLILLLNYLSYVSLTHSNQVDNDLVFEEENQLLKREHQPLHISSQNVDQKTKASFFPDAVTEFPDNLEDGPKDMFFEKVNRQINRFKQGLSDFFSWDILGSSATTETTSGTRPKRNTDETSEIITKELDDNEQNSKSKAQNGSSNVYSRGDLGGDNSVPDDDEEESETEESIYGYSSSGDPPGPGVVPSSISENYIRLVIQLSEPYENEIADQKGNKFTTLSNNIKNAIDNVKKKAIDNVSSALDFIDSKVVGITSSMNVSKVIVDLVIPGSESKENIETVLSKNLSTWKEQYSVPAERILYISNITDVAFLPCRSNELPCITTNECYMVSGRCNNLTFCDDRSDELDCVGREDEKVPHIKDLCGGRGKNTYTCPDGGYKICEDMICDGERQCVNGEDEMENCRPDGNCSIDQIYCDYKCAPLCDNNVDCSDRSDEQNCPNTPPPTTTTTTTIITPTTTTSPPPPTTTTTRTTTTTLKPEPPNTPENKSNLKAYPSHQVIKVGQEVVFLCRDEGPLRASVSWERGDGLPLPPESRINITEGRLEIPNIQLNQGGPYICKANEEADSKISVYLFVQQWSQTTPLPPTNSCKTNETTCQNGDCIAKELLCNGQPDCPDGSDERCGINGCEPNEFRCRNQRCIGRVWMCDAEDDCGDRSDEEDCPSNPPDSLCRYKEFACFNKVQCIPKSFHCDTVSDCNDGSDEIGCSKVMIRRHPPRTVVLTVHAVFNISCETFGIPTPEVVWRKNWGHVPPKCRSTSIKGVGVLTCPDIQEEDAGAYSCEGINTSGSTFAIDTILTVIGGPPTSTCPPGQFNDLANNTSECISCFCFGATSDCKSANLFTYQLRPSLVSVPLRILNVYFDNRQPALIDLTQINRSWRVNALGVNSFHIQGFENDQLHQYLYFALPQNYLGNQLKSYGGYIKYRISYEGNGVPINSPDVIISGNGYELFFLDSSFRSGRDKEQSVRLFFGSLYKLSRERSENFDSRFYQASVLASREEIMITLAKLDQILIKIRFVENRLINTSIHNFQIDSAGTVNHGQGQAAYVEECMCPNGYFGLSCENCAPGYQRYSVGSWLGQCHKTEVPKPCELGTYGDPSRGCIPCPCPLTTPPNQFARTCFRDTDGQPTCDCPVGFAGRNCERCSLGFVGNPLIPGSSCERTPCDPSGSVSLTVDPITGYCTCKENTIGPYCNQCKANTFYLSSTNIYGCIKCFCMGFTEDCFSSRLYRQQLVAVFIRDAQGFKIGGRWEIESNPNLDIIINTFQQELVFSSFDSFEKGAYYWSLPQRFLGNKVTSYGGVLNYTIRYSPTPGGQSSRNNAPDVEIISENNGIHLLYFRHEEPIEPNRYQTVSVPLLEQYWQRLDGQKTNREHLLMALADLKNIIIKATFTTTTTEVGLQSVILEVAEERNTGQRRAYEVEECRCPNGYRGTSCEECDVGYRRVDRGLYLGLCEPCNCYGHSKDCDVETGICLNCANHTTGDYCNLCEPGYSGDPTTGRACFPIRSNLCQCDERGRLNNDCRDGQCACKINVVGSNCESCRHGTFDLQKYHETGCLDCYCSGVSDVCQSSNLFVTQIPMPLLDNNHGFTLTESDRNRVIRTGFKLNIADNQIAYDYTTERGLVLFWSLPPQFTGNKITSYGGNLTWTQGYKAPPEALPTYNNDVVIFGDGISIFWANNNPIAQNTTVTTSIKLEENEFVRVTETGTQKASRIDILRVLSSIEAILIRSSQATQTSLVFISDVSLDTAVSQPLSNIRATQVEICRCPYGYKGFSCEVCISGYYQVPSSGYGKECKKCPCNGHEESCGLNANSRVICKCQTGYTGEFCEEYGSNTSPGSWLTPSTVPPSTSTIIVTVDNDTLIHIIAVGDTVRLACSAKSVKKLPVTIKWSKESGSLPEGRTFDDGNGYFVLIDAVVSDSGTYLCSAYDGESYEYKSVSVKVEDLSSPRITITPKTSIGELEFNVGDVITINCEAAGTPTPQVEWGRVGNDLPAYKRTGFRSLTYNVDSARKEDEGSYYCKATNNRGHDLQTVTIYVRDSSPSSSPDALVFITPTDFIGSVGETVRLECYPISQGYMLKWSRPGNQPLPQTAEVRNGVLIIQNASSSDSGMYVCSAISILTNNIVSQVEARVIIEGDTDPTPGNKSPPVISIDPEKQTVVQGTLAIIRCSSASDPESPVFWRKIHESMSSGVQIRGSELRIPSVQVKDRGVYVCQIKNDAGVSEVFSTLEVERREPPTVEIYPRNIQEIQEGGSTYIQCRVIKGIPPPKIRWLRRGHQTFTSHVEEINGALRFRDVTEEDEGEYLCTAENTAGSVEAIAVLEIISSPVITITPSGPLTFKAGQEIRLECSAKGKPAPTVFWDSNKGMSTTSRGIESGTAVLQITRAELSDTGSYSCIASNTAGRSEDRIQIFITEEPNPDPAPSISPNEEITVPLGSNADIRCNFGNRESVFVYWTREDRAPLSSNHDDRRGVLIIYNVNRSDAGKYTCVGVEGNTGKILFTKTVTLKVIVPPQITVNPTRQTVRPGDNAFVNCSATGDQPINIYWSSVSGDQLPRSVSVDRGLLQFHGITIYDAGRYVCRARNNGGDAEAVAEVIVNEIPRPQKPVITAEHHYRTALENSDLDLKCTVVSPVSDYEVTWSRESSDLPQNSQSIGNILRLFGLRTTDSDRYICKVTSHYGNSVDYIDLQVERACLRDEFQCNDGACIPKSLFCDTIQHCADNTDEIDCHNNIRGVNNVSLSVESSQKEVRVGDTIHLVCKINGDPVVRATWSKMDGVFEANVQNEDNILRISDVDISNTGIYRCSARTKDGTKYIDYSLNIKLSTPDDYNTAAAIKKSAKYGQGIVLDCNTDLDSPVEYSWVIHSYEKSLRKIVPNTKTLSINDLSVNNSGLYFCNAVSPRATFSIPTVLIVEDVIPAFFGSSYLTLQPLISAVHEFEIEITFKPKDYDGLILFNGQKMDSKGDYVAFGLREGVPEFRFDVGSGPAIIKGASLLKLNKWHTVRLFRHNKNGTMEVDGAHNYTGTSPGRFETLDLQLPLYIGGVPNRPFVYNLTGFRSGFNGCINKLVIDGKNYNMKKEGLQVENLGSCNNCENNPCQNHGFCQEISLSSGYTCICLPGFSGENCDLRKETCYLDSCGSGICLENDSGIECLCPFGKTGKRCRKNIDIRTAAFTKNSYLAYATPLLKKKIKFLLKLKPMGEAYVEDGIILYIAESDIGDNDFISLSIINSFVELKFRIMSKFATLRSNHYLIPNEYVNVSVSLDASEVQFRVADETPLAEAFNPNNEMMDLQLHTPLYIGGYDKKSISLPEEMDVRTGFHGCISWIEFLGTDISILQSYIESANVNDCFSQFGDICETTLPCQNGGSCLTIRNTYKCECAFSYGGQNCEKRKDICELLQPCQNNGKCNGTTGSFKCYCGLGYIGSKCEKETTLENSVSFVGDGYVELNASLLPYEAVDAAIDIRFSTASSNGLLFWQGQNETVYGAGHDFIAVAIENGYVELSYAAGSITPKVKKATHSKVNDNNTHSVSIRRMNTEVTVELDSTTVDLVDISDRLNIPGSIYIGGLPDIRFMTGNQYNENFVGCVHSLKINNPQPIDFGQKAISARNAAQCTAFGVDNQV